MLSRGLYNDRRLKDAPHTTVREAVELMISVRSINYSSSQVARRTLQERISRLGLAAPAGSPYEFHKLGLTFKVMLERAEGQGLKKSKLAKVLSLPCSRVLLYPDINPQLSNFNVLYQDESKKIKVLCLFCEDSSCQGCKEFSPPAPTEEFILRRHETNLAFTCRICGVRNEKKGSHRCKNGEACDSKICKYAFQDVIKDVFNGLDVRFEDNMIFPCKV